MIKLQIDRAIKLKISKTAAPLMVNVLSTYMEGIKEAKDASIIDFNTLDTTEKLLDCMSQYDEDYEVLNNLLERIKPYVDPKDLIF